MLQEEPRQAVQPFKPAFKPTPEQDRILTVAANSQDNIIINALAGAAKTTTLRLLAKKLMKRGTCIAFNKKTADELKKTFPGYVDCATLNSIGHKAWARATGLKLNLDHNKILKLIDVVARAVGYELDTPKGEIRRAIDLARNAGYTPRTGKYGYVAHLCGDKDDFLAYVSDQLDDGLSRRDCAFIDEVLTRSITQAKEGHVDFCDQLYMSTLFGGDFGDPGDYVAADEVQDFSPLNIEMLDKIATSGGKRRRIFAVGDERQSIYRFRGADSESMDILRTRFKMTELDLTTTFRCAQSIVRNAHWRAPNMQWAPNAPEGEVSTLQEWGPSTIPPESFIICRNNAPLFDLARKLIGKGLKFKLVGNDLLAGMQKIIRELGPDDLSTEMAKVNLSAWAQEKRKDIKPENLDAFEDKVESLLSLLKFGKTLRDVLMRIQYMNSCEGRILLMTGHKSKGLEADTVIHLDPDRIPSRFAMARAEEDPEAMTQEMNLRYVIETRPKRRLWRAYSERFNANL